MKQFLVVVAIMAMLVGCREDRTVVYQQPVQPVVAQPVYVQNPDPMTGVIAGMAIGTMMSNGQRYDGHNGYYHSGYNGPPQRIVQNVTINKTVVNNNGKNASVAPSTANAAAPAKPAVAPVAASPVTSAPAKVKNPGDEAAEKERIKMANEASLKADQQAKQDTLKRSLQEKQAARNYSPAASKSGGFNSMSKSASSSSGSSKRK